MLQANGSTASGVCENRPVPPQKPVVIGIYGIPDSEKTFLLNQLKEELEKERFSFYDGSVVIDKVVPGGLDAFKKLAEEEKFR